MVVARNDWQLSIPTEVPLPKSRSAVRGAAKQAKMIPEKRAVHPNEELPHCLSTPQNVQHN